MTQTRLVGKNRWGRGKNTVLCSSVTFLQMLIATADFVIEHAVPTVTTWIEELGSTE